MATLIENLSSNTVLGKVTDANGRPLPNLKVVIYDVDMREWQALSDTHTNREGKYELKWSHDQLSGRGRKEADIAIIVSTKEKGTVLYKSTMDDVRFNASEREEINVVISNPLPKEVVEFDFLVKEVSFLANQIAIADLQEDDEHRDVTFLSRELEVPADKIEHLIVAHRLHNLSKITPAFFYALFRKNTLLQNDFSRNPKNVRLSIGIGVDDQILLYDAALADSKKIAADIKAAAEEKIISATEAKNVKRNIEVLSIYKERASEYYRTEYPQKVVNLLTSFFKEGKLQQIQQLFAESKNDLNSFFDKITDPAFYATQRKGQDAKATMELGRLFGHDNETIQQIAKSRGIKKPKDIRKLARLNKSEWVKEIGEARPDIKDKQAISAYASAIVRRMENEFPTLAFAAQLERTKKAVLKNQDNIVSFFNKHEDFDLMKHNVDLYLKEKKVAAKEREAITQELKSVQRVFKLVPNYSKTIALLGEKIHSSQNIVAIGETRFVREIAPKAGISEKEAKEIYRKAETKHTAAMLLVGDLQDSMSVMDIASFETTALAKKLEAVSKDFPNLKSLFKLVDTCECEHCRSVYSPAAYLVEILQFLDKRVVFSNNNNNSSNAKDALFSRRPDLGEIDLSCANANTPVKYIDLVCEILEEAIAPDAGISYSGVLSDGADSLKGKISGDLLTTLNAAGLNVTPDALIYETGSSITQSRYLRDKGIVCKIEHTVGNSYNVFRLRQTFGTAEELEAAPEYVNEGAYNELKDKSYAFNLPFDLNHAEAKAYFSRFDVSRAELMKAFQTANDPSEQSIATERLELSDAESNIIVNPPTPNDNAAQQPYWNVPAPGNVVDYLKQVDHFLDRTGISYKELDLLLKLKFIDKNGNLFIRHNDLTCNTEQKEIANLDLDTLGRIHRFLRLQKKTDWKYEVLDEIISQPNLGNGILDENCLIKAAQIKEISERINIKVEELIGCFGELPHVDLQEQDEKGSKPLYHQVFLNKAKNGVIDEGLLPDKVDGSQVLNTYIGYIATCLQLKQKDIEYITPLLPDGDLTFSNLSFLFTSSRLIRSLKLKAEDFAIIQKLSGIDIIASPGKMLDFIKVVENFKRSPLKAADVKFILNHEADNLVDKSIKDEKIGEVLKSLKEGYEKINHEQKSKFDDKLTAEEQKETLQGELSKLSSITTEDLKIFMQFIDNEWNILETTKDILNNKLYAILTQANKATLTSNIDALEAVSGPNYSTEKNNLITSFCTILNPTIDLSDLSESKKINALKVILDSLTVITKPEVIAIIRYIELGNKKRFVDEKLNDLFDTTIIKATIDEFDSIADSQKENDIKNYQAAILDLKIANEELRTANVKLSNATTPAEFAAANALVAAANAHIATATDTLLLATPSYNIASGKNLLEAFLNSISNFLISTSKRRLLEQTLSTTFKADLALVGIVLKHAKLKQPAPGNDLISDLLSDNYDQSISLATYPKQYAAIQLLHKMFVMLNAFKFPGSDVEWYFANNAALGWLELDSIPYDAGQPEVDFTQYLNFCNIVFYSKQFTAVTDPLDAERPISFFTLANIISEGDNNKQSEFFNKLALLTGYEQNDLIDMDAHLFVPFDLANYKDAENWKRLFDCMDLGRKLGAGITQIKGYIKGALTASEVSDLRAALKSRYDEDTWLSTLKEIMDAIRPQKRDALVAYLLATNPGIKDTNDLYEYFLIDVQMESLVMSSRIVLAHNSIQLFVQRCLMGLEPDAIADTERDPNWDQWKWMKNYRVWEANRKVFLYPENWYDVTLTDDKTYLLTEFINEIQQNELTNDTAEEALKAYLEKLDNIAFLEVMATWYDVPTRDMHVFARTKGGAPAIYYYRRFENERYWTPWEKVELDITGDHLLAFKRNGRLHLAWPIFSEEAEVQEKIVIPSSTPGSEVEAQPRKKLKIQLAISEYSNKKWQPKRVSHDAILTPSTYRKFIMNQITNKFNLIYYQTTDQIKIFSSAWKPYYDDTHNLVGIFNMAGCKGYPELLPYENINFPDFYPDFKDAELRAQRYNELIEYAPDDLAVRNIMSPFDFYTILNATPGKFRISYPHQFTKIDSIGFIYQLLQLIINHSSQNVKGRKEIQRIEIPLGTLLPYFEEDSYHAYVIIPGFYKKAMDKGEFVETYSLNDSEKRTASNVFQLLDDITNWFKKITYEFQQNPPADTQAAVQTILTDFDFQNILKELSKYADLDIFLNLLIGQSGNEKVDEFLKELTQAEPLKYGEQFKNMYHPLVCALRSILYKDGIPALMKRDTQLQKTNFDFESYYHPHHQIVPLTDIKNPDGTKIPSYPIEDIDFNSDGSYSAYNWDLFFRVPLHIASSLTKNQRFEEALTWFHYMFNPTGALPGNGVQKYWVTKPFYLNQETDYIIQRIDTLMYAVSDPSHPNVPAGASSEPAIRDLEFAISEWRNKPFKPDVVMRFRPVAYQKALLMKYIDNLTEWGDYLFRQDTMESIAQATQMYILADKLLGPKPRVIPAAIKQPYETYNQVEAKLDSFGNALIELENILPDLSVLPESGAELPATPVTLSMLYFCIPANEKMFEYWDRVADRIFKIRHCQNIDGVERSLALFAPPIDPGMLVRATASGLDISSVIAGLNAPTPYYRFNVLSQKATELAQEVRGLGNSLLQVLEKKDAEALTLLRNELELKVLNAVKDIKKLQINESKEQIEVLKRTKNVTEERQKYYANIQKIISKEQLNLDKLGESKNWQLVANITYTLGATLALIPDLALGASGFGGSPHGAAKFGGSLLAHSTDAIGKGLGIFSAIASYEASCASILGGYDRRFDDWKLQERLATKELASIDKQITAAELRKEIAETDLKNHELQIENAKKTDDFMRSKFTNMELYDWMVGQISSVYFKSYQLAHDFAKKAERCYQFELGNSDTFISYGYWDSLKKGLQSADALIHDIKRMEASYLDKNKREYEITKHVSLAQLDPLALIRLRASGICDFEIPEVLYDMDHPGQYFRRIKSVSVSLPCIAGPYTSVSAKLSLVNNRYRKNTNDPANYAEDIVAGDDRFNYNVGSIQSIATSNAQNDSGVFELNFRDERYLPFENTGAISSWRLELPTEIRQFDYNTISDVIIHLKYTAREGGSGLKTAANTSLKEQFEAFKQGLGQTGLHIALNMKHDMPNEWHLLKQNGEVNLAIGRSRLPYIAQSVDTVEIKNVIFVAKVKDNPTTFPINVNAADTDTNLTWVDDLKLYRGSNDDINLGTSFNLKADRNKLEELILIVKYEFE